MCSHTLLVAAINLLAGSTHDSSQPPDQVQAGFMWRCVGLQRDKEDLCCMIWKERSTPAWCGAAAAGDVAVISCRGWLFGTSFYHERFRVELHSSARLSGRLLEDDLSEWWFRVRCSPPSRAAVGDREGGGKWMRDEKEKTSLWCIIAVLDEDTEGWAWEKNEAKSGDELDVGDMWGRGRGGGKHKQNIRSAGGQMIRSLK